jgi:hypothetical protein
MPQDVMQLKRLVAKLLPGFVWVLPTKVLYLLSQLRLYGDIVAFIASIVGMLPWDRKCGSIGIGSPLLVDVPVGR